MSGTALADLDELVLQCRDERARAYIAEAVACYRGGAYRATIVATWVAVCFDIIDKLRELALAGDKEADRVVSEIEKTRQSNDIARALKMERDLLSLATDKFELLSHLEHIDLERLQQDRNRCAHPSLVSEDQAFAPSGELARLHIRSAVTHLLQHPPVQGKHALDRLLREIGSEYFPDDVGKATASLSSGPLKKPRESLVRNFTVVLIKRLLNESLDWKQRWRTTAALGAVRTLHGRVFEATLKDKLPALIRSAPDQNLHLATHIICSFVEGWEMLPTDVRNRLEEFVANLPADELTNIDKLLECPPFVEKAMARAARVTRKEFKDLVLFVLPGVLGDRCIQLYLASRSFAEANDFAKALAPYLGDLAAQQQRRLLEGISKNDEVLHSFEVGNVIGALRRTRKIGEGAFETLLKENGLEMFMLDAGDEP